METNGVRRHQDGMGRIERVKSNWRRREGNEWMERQIRGEKRSLGRKGKEGKEGVRKGSRRMGGDQNEKVRVRRVGVEE
jgi:hypothetical protein